MSVPTTTYGFIGLGNQGAPMAERMVAAGLRPWVWARRSEVVERFRDAGARIAASPADLAARCDVIGLCLFDEAATDAVLDAPEGLREGLRPGTVVAMHATVAPAYVVDLARDLGDRDVRLVDAPVSGGEHVARAGNLVVIVGGDEDPRQACQPMFDTYAGRVIHVGPVGAAQAAKLVNNTLMAAITGLVFDAFAVGRRLGLEESALGAVLATASAANPSVPVYLELGAERFSLYAWPTLQKDVTLTEAADADAAPTGHGLLLRTARTTLDEMQRLRGGTFSVRRDTATATDETSAGTPTEGSHR